MSSIEHASTAHACAARPHPASPPGAQAAPAPRAGQKSRTKRREPDRNRAQSAAGRRGADLAGRERRAQPRADRVAQRLAALDLPGPSRVTRTAQPGRGPPDSGGQARTCRLSLAMERVIP